MMLTCVRVCVCAFSASSRCVGVKKWDDGVFDISADDDQRIEDLTLDTAADLNDPEVQAFIRTMILVERKKDSANPNHGLKRHCKSCQIFKPDRAHHCKVCNQLDWHTRTWDSSSKLATTRVVLAHRMLVLLTLPRCLIVCWCVCVSSCVLRMDHHW